MSIKYLLFGISTNPINRLVGFFSVLLFHSLAFGQTYIQGPALIEVPTITATAAGTTTLTISSQTNQQFTGSTTQTVVMPAATTLQLGRRFYIANRSTDTVTVNANGGTLLRTIPAGSQAEFRVMANGTAAGTWDVTVTNASDIVAGVLAAIYGGTGQTGYTFGDTLYASSTTALSKLAGNTTTTAKFLSQVGNGTVSAAPSWLQPACSNLSNAAASCSTDTTNAANISTGLLAVARGGTGIGSGTSGGIPYYSTTSTIASSASLAASQLVVGGGAGTTPATLPAGSQYVPLTMGASAPGYTALALNQAAATSGQLINARGGTGLDTSASTGVPSVSTGTWTVNNFLPVTLGGSGAATFAAHNVLLGEGTSAFVPVTPNTSGFVLTSNGATSDPSFQAPAVTTSLTTKGDVQGFSTVNARIPVGSDNAVLSGDSSSPLGVTYQRSPVGGKNYISNPSFESNTTTGWVLSNIPTLTNGLPTSTSPTFGSGASGTLSISSTNTAPLSGTYSLSYASSAATTAGDAVCTQATTIDSSGQAKTLAFSFNYKVSSGTVNLSGTSSNSYGAAVWDATNSVWLGTTGNFNLVQGTGVGTAAGTVTTSSTTASIRLCVYNVTATSGAATMLFDDFYLGPQQFSSGFAGSDSIAYTPTFVGMGTVTIGTSNDCTYRRVGPALVADCRITTGTATATVASMTLPAGLSVSTILGSITQVGDFSNTSTTTSQQKHGVVLATGGNTLVQFSTDELSLTLNPFTAQNGNAVFLNSTVTHIKFTVPIQGWSSNTVQSADSGAGRPPILVLNGSTTTIGTSNTAITPTTITTDNYGSFSGSTYTLPVTGCYTESMYIKGSSTAYSNGTTFQIGLNQAASATMFATKFIEVTQTETIGLNGSYGFCGTAGQAIQFLASSPVSTATTSFIASLTMQPTGSAVIQAPDSIGARYYSSSTTVSGTLATIIYSTKDWDLNSSYNSGTGVYTCSISGRFQVNASIAMTGTFILNSILDLQVVQAGSSTHTAESKTYSGGAVTQMNTNVGDIFYCLQGDTITVKASNSGTTPVIAATTTQNWFSIHRIGN